MTEETPAEEPESLPAWPWWRYALGLLGVGLFVGLSRWLDNTFDTRDSTGEDVGFFDHIVENPLQFLAHSSNKLVTYLALPIVFIMCRRLRATVSLRRYALVSASFIVLAALLALLGLASIGDDAPKDGWFYLTIGAVLGTLTPGLAGLGHVLFAWFRQRRRSLQDI
ncbi:hypothetical protein Aph01nite_00740 [Acrocarpospora phusangensis]|uniref:Uncharacterized protein n=1 Tax=Acrocarpospora phusangensis TaxID=1070424 RepID=A0A919Q3Q4_9ACTN|nr:hypothetical protein [Acrocarpospora phusangensis]GIH21764.1 hypothetical protein Aph01nite_00740 [Acrocarpospora phusangensis]